MTIFYFDPENGNNASAGTSFATRKRSIQSGAPSLAAGDVARFISSPDPTSLGINATWTNKSATVTLASSLTQLITNCGTNWTPSTNVTSAVDTGVYREGTSSIKLDIANAFTTGLAAYFATGALDLSAYRQLSFWFRVGSGGSVFPANTVRIDLCSDVAGTTPVDSFTIPFSNPGSTERWIPVTIDKGATLGASIQSIALNVLVDPGFAFTVYLDDFIAVKDSTSADSLSLTSLIGKNTGDETWWAIRSINGTIVILDQAPTMTPSSTGRGYSGVTETVTTYKRETVKTDLIVDFTDVNTTSNSGNSGNVILISGGWNRTDMSTQTGESWLDGRTGTSYGLALKGNFLTVEKMAMVRYNYGTNITTTANGLTITGLVGNNNTTYGINHTLSGALYSNISINSLSSNQVGFNGVPLYTSFGNLKNINSNVLGSGLSGGSVVKQTGVVSCNNNSASGMVLGGGDFGTVTCNDNGQFGISIQNGFPINITSLSATGNSSAAIRLSAGTASCRDVRIYSLTTSNNGPAAPNDLVINNSTGTFGGEAYIFNAVTSETIKINSITDYSGFRLYSHKEGGTVDNHIIRTDGATIRTETGADRHTASGTAWKVSITSTIRSSIYPVEFSIAKFAVSANQLLTFGAWLKKSHATNINCRLVIPGGRISGIPSDLFIDASNITTYQFKSITATPTEKGVIEVFLHVWAGSGAVDYVVIDDLVFTQV